MQNKTLVTMVALVCLGLGACQKSNKGEVVDFNALSQKSLPAKDKAEIISLAAEKLVYSDGFKFANKHFNAALELDPGNARARFYKSILAVAKINKGAFVKIDPVINKLDINTQREFQATVDNMPASHTKEFLLKGEPTIFTENDAQAHVREIQEALRNVRKTLTELKNEGAEFTLHTSQVRQGFTASDVLKNCPVVAISADAYSMPECDFLEHQDFKMSWADFEAAKVVVAAYIINLSPATAYDLAGAEHAARRLARYETVTDEMIVNAIKKEPKLGQLADGGVLKEIISMGAEGVEALKLAQTKQGDLCKTGSPSPENRPGYLFLEGFCLDKTVMANVATAQAVAQGATAVVASQGYSTVVDASKFLNGSITDLKSLLPNKFNKCQQAIGLADPTLGGVFPRGDFVEIERVDHPDFLNPYCDQQ